MESKLKFEIDKLKYNQTKKLVDEFLNKNNLLKIKNISEKFGLSYKINLDIEIVSAETKYLFNYLSGAFGNKNLKEGAKNITEFIQSKEFNESIKHFSGRALYDKKILEKVNLSLSYLENSKFEFVPILKNLCNKLIKKIEKTKFVILLGVSKYEKIIPFERLLVHEIFHIVLYDNKIKFEDLGKKYAKYDEGLAIFLSYVFGGNVKKILEIKDNYEKKIVLFWYKQLLLVPQGKETDKIKEVYNKFKLN